MSSHLFTATELLPRLALLRAACTLHLPALPWAMLLIRTPLWNCLEPDMVKWAPPDSVAAVAVVQWCCSARAGSLSAQTQSSLNLHENSFARTA